MTGTYTDSEVQHLADVLADARLRGVQAGMHTLARLVLDAGYRHEASEPRAAVLTWDWRGQPDLNALGRALRELSGGRLNLRKVDTGSDEYAIVIANIELDGHAADAGVIYDGWSRDDNAGDGEVMPLTDGRLRRG